MIWQNTKNYVNFVDGIILRSIEQFKLIDKVRVAMFVTWLWALFGLYTAKAFESFFKIILKMPDKWLVMPGYNTTPEGVRILQASDGKQDITNKFKLFLKYYWEQDENGGGFSFASLQRLMNCSMLYCSYLLTDKDGSVTPECFWQNVNRFLIELEPNVEPKQNSKCVKYIDPKLTDKQEVPFGMVQFNTTRRRTRKTNNKTRQELLDFMSLEDQKNTHVVQPVVQQLVQQFENNLTN